MITKRDILSALGAEIREDHFLSGMLIGIGVGAIVGGAAAMLMTPRTGSELRQIVRERVPQMVERAKSRVGLGNGNKIGQAAEGKST